MGHGSRAFRPVSELPSIYLSVANYEFTSFISFVTRYKLFEPTSKTRLRSIFESKSALLKESSKSTHTEAIGDGQSGLFFNRASTLRTYELGGQDFVDGVQAALSSSQP